MKQVTALPGVPPASSGWNTFKTGILLAALTGLFLAIGGALGGQGGIAIAFVIALVMNVGSYWFSDKIALAVHRARPLPPEEAPWL